jgi:hypothetical protein
VLVSSRASSRNGLFPVAAPGRYRSLRDKSLRRATREGEADTVKNHLLAIGIMQRQGGGRLEHPGQDVEQPDHRDERRLVGRSW